MTRAERSDLVLVLSLLSLLGLIAGAGFMSYAGMSGKGFQVRYRECLVEVGPDRINASDYCAAKVHLDMRP